MVLALALSSPAYAAVEVEFTWSPSSPQPGEEVTFTSTRDEGSYAWDLDNDGQFDDGSTKSVSRTFEQDGTYKVRLRVTNGEGTGQKDHDVKVVTPNSPPTAAFTIDPSSPAPGQEVTFTSTSSDAEGELKEQRWDLDGDNRFDDGSGAVAHRSYKAGTYKIGLRVTDSDDQRATAYYTLVVAEPPAPTPADPGQPADPAPPESAPLFSIWPSPFPSVRVRGRATRRGVRLSLLAVRGPSGSTVVVRCKGRRCPARRTVHPLEGERIRLKRYERFFPAGTVLQIFVRKDGLVGKYVRFRFRRLKAPVRTDRCLMPGQARPVRCPG